MHKTIVIVVAATAGLLGSLLLHAFKTLTILGLGLCAICIGSVAAFAVFPSVTIRKLSIRLKHATRRLFHRLLQTKAHQSYGSTGDVSYLMLGVFGLSAAIALHELIAAQPASSERVAAVTAQRPSVEATMPPHDVARPFTGVAIKEAMPVIAPALDAIERSHFAQPHALDTLTQTQDQPRWIWLIRLLFAESPDAA